jgi:hypothetical protein
MLRRSAGCQTDGLEGCPGTERAHMQRICSTTPVSSQARAADLVADLRVYTSTQKRAAVQRATRYPISNTEYRMAWRQCRPGDIPFGKALLASVAIGCRASYFSKCDTSLFRLQLAREAVGQVFPTW